MGSFVHVFLWLFDTGYDQSYHLSVGDVRVDSTTSPLFIEVYIKASKTEGSSSLFGQDEF